MGFPHEVPYIVHCFLRKRGLVTRDWCWKSYTTLLKKTLGFQGKAWKENASQGKINARHSMERKARNGKARQGKARHGKERHHMVWNGKPCHGMARQGKARQGNAREGKAMQVKERQGKERLGKQGKERKGKARHSSLTTTKEPQNTRIP